MTALIPRRSGSHHRGLGRALLTALIGLLAMFAFDTVAHASDRTPNVHLPGNHCVVTVSMPASDAIATTALVSAAGDPDGDRVAGLPAGGHDGANEPGHGVGHGALASCLALLGAGIAFALRARWWRRRFLTTLQRGASRGLSTPAPMLTCFRLSFLDLGILRI